LWVEKKSRAHTGRGKTTQTKTHWTYQFPARPHEVVTFNSRYTVTWGKHPPEHVGEEGYVHSQEEGKTSGKWGIYFENLVQNHMAGTRTDIGDTKKLERGTPNIPGSQNQAEHIMREKENWPFIVTTRQKQTKPKYPHTQHNHHHPV